MSFANKPIDFFLKLTQIHIYTRSKFSEVNLFFKKKRLLFRLAKFLDFFFDFLSNLNHFQNHFYYLILSYNIQTSQTSINYHPKKKINISKGKK